MTTDFTKQLINEISLSIKGWNEKLELTDSQLALMVPFCDLYARFPAQPEDPGDAGLKRLYDSGFLVNLKGFDGVPISTTLVPVFNLLEQQTTTDETGKLLRPRGVGGIESCTITTFDENLGSYQITLGIEIPSFDEDIKVNRALRKLVQQGTDWVIGYGWARDSSKNGAGFLPIDSNNTIDLTTSHGGYYRFMQCWLQKYDWRINSNRIVTGTLEFGSYLEGMGILNSFKRNRMRIKDLLSKPEALIGECEKIPSIRSKLPKEISIGVKRDFFVNVSNGKKKVAKQEKGYFYLGWVIEAIRQISDNGKGNWTLTTFPTWDPPKKTKIMMNADGSKEPVQLTCDSPASIPISVSDFDAEIDLSTNETVLWSIDKICQLANKQLFDAAEIFVELGCDGKTLHVRDANDFSFNSSNRKDSMKIGVSTPNSLLLDISLNSRIPQELTWMFSYFINTDEGSAILYNMFEAEAASNKKDSEISETALLIRKFHKPDNKKVLDVNRSSNWKSYLEKSDKNKLPQIVSEVMQSSTVPVGLALRNFYKTITVTVHGTAMVPPLTQLDIRGILPGIDGLYEVFQITDSLTPGNFTSELEASLLNAL